MYSSLDARSTSLARDLLKRPACGRPTRCEDAAPKSPEARRQFTRTEPSPAGVWGLCDVAPITGRARNERQTGAPRRRADAAAREIQFAGELASQRPPSRERPSLGGAGQGHALSPSLSLAPCSRSIDDAEHRLRQVRGPPACSSAGTSLSAAAAAAAAALCKESHLPAPARRPDDDPAVPSGRGRPWDYPGPRGRRGPFATGLPF